MKKETIAIEFLIASQVLNPRPEQITRSPDNPVHRVAFSKQQLRQVRSVLAGNAGDQRNFRFSCHEIEDMEGVTASSSGLMPEGARLRKVNIFVVGSCLIIVLLIPQSREKRLQ